MDKEIEIVTQTVVYSFFRYEEMMKHLNKKWRFWIRPPYNNLEDFFNINYN